jgi:hypothetical protein
MSGKEFLRTIAHKDTEIRRRSHQLHLKLCHILFNYLIILQ